MANFLVRIVVRQLINRIVQRLPIRRVFSKPLLIVPAAAIAVTGYHIHVFIPVVGCFHFEGLFALIVLRRFLIVRWLLFFPSFGCRGRVSNVSGHWSQICERLQMTLADCSGVVPGVCKQVDECCRIFRQGAAVIAKPM